MISLCIPTYNRLPLLEQCLNSILGKFNDYPYEVIIADGGSTDGTIEYLHGIDSDNIKLIEQGKLTGITKAYNASFKIAEGDYIYIGNDDTILYPEVIIKACKLMDEESQIGLVAPKNREPRHGNVHSVTFRIKKYWALLSKFHIIRNSIFKKTNYLDESYRSYFIDDDSCLSVLNSGCTTIFTREIGMIHYRVPDKNVNIARATNYDKKRVQQDYNYLQKKWEKLRIAIEEYLNDSPMKKRRSASFAFLCDKIYNNKSLHFLSNLGLYDWSLKHAIVFKDKKYDHLKDFYLAQKYPNEIISSHS